MPPKKAKSLEKQTKIFSKQTVQIPPVKSKSKQFSSTDDLPKGGSKGQTSVSKWSYGNGVTPKKLMISSWNVNGIRAVVAKGDLVKYATKSKPDIICFNETKIDEQAYEKEKGSLSQISGFQGYHQYWNFCKVSSGYSGVAIFSKHQAIKCIEDLPKHPNLSQEGRVITLQFEKFYLITAYIPNAGQKLERLDYRVKQWDAAFQEHCEQLKKTKTVILSGDLNVCHQEIDIARPNGNQKTAGFTPEERNSFSAFLKKGWVDTFRQKYPKQVKYSWWSMRTGGRSKNIGWRLDYFVINKEAEKWAADSLINNDIMGSDHCPIQLFLIIP